LIYIVKRPKYSKGGYSLVVLFEKKSKEVCEFKKRAILKLWKGIVLKGDMLYE